MKTQFSYYLNGIATIKPYKNIALPDVVKAIGCQKSKKLTEAVRKIADEEESNKFKRKYFDYVTFSGTFNTRANSQLIDYSGYMVIDIDDTNPAMVREKLLNQTYFDIALMFTSPRGYGVKVVVASTTADEHKQVFEMYKRCLNNKLGVKVDSSGSDIARACFIAYDEEVYYNPNIKFRKIEDCWEEPAPISETPLYTTTQTNAMQYEGLSPFDDFNNRGDVLSLLEAHGWRRCETKANNIRFTRPGKTSGVSADFRLSDKLFYVFTSNSVFEPQKGYNPTQVFTLLNYGTLNTEAYSNASKQLQEMGYGEQKVIPSPYTTHTRSVKEESGALNFYTDSYKITASHLAQYFNHDGFIRISEPGNDAITIIKNNNKILKPFNYKTDTISYLTEQIAHPEKKADLENLLVSKRNTIQNSWELLQGEPYNLHRDTKDAIYLPFKNGVCKITKKGIEMVDYKSKEIAFFIDNLASQKHNFETVDISKRGIGDFEKFLIYAIVGRETQELTQNELTDVKAFYSMIGYLISNYKNPAQSPAVILSDEGADDEARRGGRGKSLLVDAITKVRGSKFRDGAKFETGYRHVYADLEKYHDIYILDDVKAGFNFNDLYTDITGDITAERKGLHAVTISFADAPKFVITTNWAVRHDRDADSTNRRFVEYKFSHYWNIDHTPESYFGKRFFDDWNSAEWQLFYEFLIACSMQFLTSGLQRITYSKDEDNYRAYFSNDVVLEEFERVFEEMKDRGNFNVTDFLKEHDNNSLFRFKKIFNHINTKRRIDTYIKKHEVNIDYSQAERRWYFHNTPSNDIDKVENSQLHFAQI